MLCGQVGDAAGWWVAADAGVGSVVVVPVQPVGKRGLPFDVGGVGPLVGPFLKQGAMDGPLKLVRKADVCVRAAGGEEAEQPVAPV
ncbi:hypothetical protein GCM10023323_67060 [Streptomyces thinghirensis]|uniref:Uncharacterized protein n=1 Tax=Streptomyces thinghirensis TaxID=551547 RepID=A0ABP9TC85_9ACTN